MKQFKISFQKHWEEWKRNIQQLSEIKSNRCFVAKGGKKIKHCSLHNISNVTEEGYC